MGVATVPKCDAHNTEKSSVVTLHQSIVWYLTPAYESITAGQTKDSVLSAEIGCITGEYATWYRFSHVLRQDACGGPAR